MLIQGITFETVDRSDICFALDRLAHTSGDLFYDCRFIGGSICMGIAVNEGPNCEHIMLNRCSFENGDIGWANGNMNALMNMVHKGTFRNNRINIAMRRNDVPSRAWPNCGVLSAEFIGTKEKDFEFEIHKARYFLNITSDSPTLCTGSKSSKYYDIQFFENCRWTAADDVFYESRTSAGPIFLYSRAAGGRLNVQPPTTNTGFALNLWSDIAGWEESVKAADAQKVRFLKVD